ncbi:MAG: gluconate 2-dehydrogenase subunit 3 family protein [Leeuwenhoekiella sp.]
MQRREAIKNIALASIAAMVMTKCDFSEDDVTKLISKGKLDLNDKHAKYLSQISETFLPIKGREGNLGQPEDFIMTMVNDCRSEEDRAKFARGFNDYKSLMTQTKLDIDTDKPDEVIAAVRAALEAKEPNEDLIYFIETVRDLSIKSVTSSQHFMQDYMDYQLIPTEYVACYNISENKNERI